MIYLSKWNHYKSARVYAKQQICVEKHSISIFDEGKKRWFFGKFSIFLMSTSFKPDLNCPQCSIKDVVLIQQHQKNNGFQQQHKQQWIVFLV